MIHKNGNTKYGITKRDLPFPFIEGCHETKDKGGHTGNHSRRVHQIM